jgi:pimeloyl-ACP methyl ester carboxylesterase
METIVSPTSVDVDLHWEAKDAGRAVLLVPGTPGDGGQFAALADELSADHLVVTYDRRGTSRSAAPSGWSQTSVAEQAEDAAAVLSGVGVRAATVFGTSNGAMVTLELALRHPERVRLAVLHEMPLLSVVAEPAPVVAAIQAVIGAAMERGGTRAALDAFLRFAFGDAVVDAWPPELSERMLANADMVFSVEMPAFQSYRPDEAALGQCRAAVAVLVGEEQQAPFFAEAARWLADRLVTTVRPAPGAHGPYFTSPERLAACLRDLETSPAG